MLPVRVSAFAVGGLVLVVGGSAFAREIGVEPPTFRWYSHDTSWYHNFDDFKNAMNTYKAQLFQICMDQNASKPSFQCQKDTIIGSIPEPLWPAYNGQPYFSWFRREILTVYRSSATSPIQTYVRIYPDQGGTYAVFAEPMCPQGTTLRVKAAGTISVGGVALNNYEAYCSFFQSDPPVCPQRSAADPPAFGNPIDSSTGDKRQSEMDFRLGMLDVSRVYSSLQRVWRFASLDTSLIDYAKRFGDTAVGSPLCYRTTLNWRVNNYPDTPTFWTSVPETYCLRYVATPTDLNTVAAIRPSGARAVFVESASGQFSARTRGGGTLEISSDTTSSTPWLYRTDDDAIELYGRDGQLVSRTLHDGQQVSYGYTDGRTSSVYDSSGRQLLFSYTGDQVTRVQLPDGNTINYQWATAGALESVTLQDGSVRRYHYDEPEKIGGSTYPVLLTGITDELGVRVSAYTYDATGRGLSTEYAGGAGRYSFAYYTTWTRVTTPLGSTLNLSFRTDPEGNKQLSSSSQPAGSGCTAASSSLGFDAAGNATRRDDFKGNRSCHKYDLTRNLETARVEGLSSSSACPADAATYVIPTNLAADRPQIKVSTQWHPDWRLETKRAEPKKLTTWVYNGQPDPSAGNAIASCAPADALLPDGKPIAVLCKKIEQATTDASGTQGFAATPTGGPRSWTYTYKQYGQVLSEDGPRTDVSDATTYTYYSDTVFDAGGAGHTMGDLWKITNAKGQVTEFTLYDKHGHPLEIVDPNGLITRLTYHVRGWLTGKSVGPASGPRQETRYDYDAAGQLKKVTNPDGSHLAYTYDAAHRLTDVTDSLGNRIHYTLDAMGNRTKEEVKDPNGTLVRSQRRVYDALNRVQNLVTPAY